MTNLSARLAGTTVSRETEFPVPGRLISVSGIVPHIVSDSTAEWTGFPQWILSDHETRTVLIGWDYQFSRRRRCHHLPKSRP